MNVFRFDEADGMYLAERELTALSGEVIQSRVKVKRI
jgi:hypothetical protein